MKKTIFTVLAVGAIVGCCLINACSSEDEPRTYTPEPKNEAVGVAHNEGLAFIFEKIKQLPETREGVKKISDDALLGYINEYLVEKGESPLADLTLAKSVALTEGVEFKPFNNSRPALPYIKRLIKIGSTTTDLQSLLYAVTKLEQDISSDNSLDRETKESLLLFLSVYRHSAEYWDANLEDWHLAIYQPSSGVNTRAKIDWGKVWDWTWKTALKDAGGAIGGLFTGNVVGGAVGASAVYAIDRIIKEYDASK